MRPQPVAAPAAQFEQMSDLFIQIVQVPFLKYLGANRLFISDNGTDHFIAMEEII